MERKKLLRTAYTAVVWLAILAAVLVTATYAWFTFDPSTNVTPMSSTVSKGDVSLLIANSANGEFGSECALILEGQADDLSPVSTADLSGFYISKAQNRKGISILFADASDQVDQNTMHGKVYLKCENGDCDVYFYRSRMKLGGDSQTLAALRLGIKLTTRSGSQTYIFRLDDMGDTSSAKAVVTIPQAGSVIAAAGSNGEASFVKDPSEGIGNYMAREKSTDDPEPDAGNAVLCRLQADEIATVEYWLYLEGCDENCIGEVQRKEIDLQLAFAGVAIE